MNSIEHLLAILEEECGELAEEALKVSRRASKALRFGLDEIQPGQALTNAERVAAELNDLLGVAERLAEAGALVGLYDRAAIDAKKAKVRKFMDYSEDYGTLADGAVQSGAVLPVCGANPTLDADLVGCGAPFIRWGEVYRCADCGVPFHRHCIRKHFDAGDVLTVGMVEEQGRRDEERRKEGRNFETAPAR